MHASIPILTSGLRWPATRGVTRQLTPLALTGGVRPFTSRQASPARKLACTDSFCHLYDGIHGIPAPRRIPASRAAFGTEASSRGNPIIHDLFERNTGTWQYVVADPATLTAVIIDPVLDYDPATQAITTRSADTILALVKEKGYQIDNILETHAHADHLTSASYLQSRLSSQAGSRPPICIGSRIGQVQKAFGRRYGIPADEYQDVFGKLFGDDETFSIGKLEGMAIYLPGHTPDHLGYKIGGQFLSAAP